jgi:tetratricopeptide (TPR) repeat protein
MIRCATHAARRTGDQHRAARLLFLSAAGCGRLAQYEESLAQFQACGRLFEELGSVAWQVRAQAGVAWILGRLGRGHEGVDVARQALELQRREASASPEWMRMALHQLATALEQVGEHEEALGCCEEWETIRGGRFIPVSHGLIATEKSKAYNGLGRYAQAVDESRRALEFFEQSGSWEDRAVVRSVLGDAHHGLGDLEEARRWWMEALMSYEDARHPDADKVRAKLAALPEN